MNDTPTTAAEMREAAAAAYDSVADPLLNEPCAFKRACFRAGWDAGRRALPSDDGMVERVARALCCTGRNGAPCSVVNCPGKNAIHAVMARAAIAAMRGE